MGGKKRKRVATTTASKSKSSLSKPKRRKNGAKKKAQIITQPAPLLLRTLDRLSAASVKEMKASLLSIKIRFWQIVLLLV